jgi:hypothetical protein
MIIYCKRNTMAVAPLRIASQALKTLPYSCILRRPILWPCRVAPIVHLRAAVICMQARPNRRCHYQFQ